MDLFEHIGIPNNCDEFPTRTRLLRKQANTRAKPSKINHVGLTSGRARHRRACISHDEHANSGTNTVAQSSFRFEIAGSDVRLIVQIAQQSDRPAQFELGSCAFSQCGQSQPRRGSCRQSGRGRGRQRTFQGLRVLSVSGKCTEKLRQLCSLLAWRSSDGE